MGRLWINLRMKRLIFVLLLTSCAPAPKPELDAVKVQRAFSVIREHLIAIEQKIRINQPTPTPTPKK